MPVLRRRRWRPARELCSLRSRFCRRSSSAILTSLPRPEVERVHCPRKAQLPQASGSNSTTCPQSKLSTSPAGQVVVLSRPLITKSVLVKRSPVLFRVGHGLHTTSPPSSSTALTASLLR